VGEWPLASNAPSVALEPKTADATPPEDDDQLRWFVDLFVAEYASEA